ncbi:hypothetical protein CAPTEDRAFT_147507 [Capitella teleta]|uniref:Molybdopterin-guanine dinucleotide biosynthesis protein B (MobB) domain-containing protein n=1 Tax=Capitella teleta TaxID=283909 RepID=R7V4S9_CAPTE|nr:hypothetical protein CAPTEDRAFT_147507 [Capitella teleta]|eukprot:ELU11366.1 hypothetical protein CAPTEDRAFT_147507 [Capitella teleta]
MNKTPVFGVVGWKNSGKTHLITRIISNFRRRGYRVSTVKHAHHAFDIDQEGRDSYRHRKAGAGEVLVASRHRWALMHEGDNQEPKLAELIAKLSPCDLILVEGFKQEAHDKLEVCRAEAQQQEPLAGRVPGVVALARELEPGAREGLPCFSPNDDEGITDWIEQHCGLQRPPSAPEGEPGIA